MLHPLNMMLLKHSRKKPQDGDIFAMSYEVGYLFGRVMLAEIPNGRPMPACSVVYIYEEIAPDMNPDISLLTPGRLLIPPQVIHHSMWRMGLFETVSHVDLVGGNFLPQTCFRDNVIAPFVDLYGNPVEDCYEPCADWGMNSAASLDDEISRALKLPVVSRE